MRHEQDKTSKEWQGTALSTRQKNDWNLLTRALELMNKQETI